MGTVHLPSALDPSSVLATWWMLTEGLLSNDQLFSVLVELVSMLLLWIEFEVVVMEMLLCVN